MLLTLFALTSSESEQKPCLKQGENSMENAKLLPIQIKELGWTNQIKKIYIEKLVSKIGNKNSYFETEEVHLSRVLPK